MTAAESQTPRRVLTPTPTPPPSGGGSAPPELRHMRPPPPGIATSRGLAGGEEGAHSVERLEDVLGRVGVGQTQIAFAENAEVGAADGDDAGVVEQGVGELLGLPAGAL